MSFVRVFIATVGLLIYSYILGKTIVAAIPFGDLPVFLISSVGVMVGVAGFEAMTTRR